MINGAETKSRRTLARLRQFTRWLGPAVVIEVGVIGLLFVIGFAVSDSFRTLDNIVNIFEQTTGLAFVALGQTVVILAGGIDLSLDANIALTSSLLSGVVNGNADVAAPMIAAVLAIGVAIGLVNGSLILLLRVHPLIVTLAVAAVIQGITLLYTLMPIGGMPEGFRRARLRARVRHPDRSNLCRSLLCRCRVCARVHTTRETNFRVRRRACRRSPGRHTG